MSDQVDAPGGPGDEPMRTVGHGPREAAGVQPDYGHFWRGLIRAVDAEPTDRAILRGVSGVSHDLAAVGVDEGRHRLIVISNEVDARGAALAQADLEAAVTPYRVVVARPVLFDLPAIARKVVQMTGSSSLSPAGLSQLGSDQAAIQASLDPYVKPLMELAGSWVPNAQGVGTISLIQAVAQLLPQLSTLRWSAGPETPLPDLDLTALAGAHILAQDEALGICPIPLFDFTGDEMEVVNLGSDREAIRELLRVRGIFQYFFPAADQLTLGLVDRGLGTRASLIEQIGATPELGHPFGNQEIVDQQTDITALIDALQQRDLLVEGEFGFEVGPDGRTLRTSVKFQPRESLVSKIINRVSVRLNIKQLFKL